jgi:hypothetical protein
MMTIAAARMFLDAALREEGDALAAACAVLDPAAAGKAQHRLAMRSVEAAHARSSAAMGRLRLLTQSAERSHAAIGSATAAK